MKKDGYFIVLLGLHTDLQGLGRPKSSMGLWPHSLQFQWAISRFNGPSKYFEGPFQATILSNFLLIPVITVLRPSKKKKLVLRPCF
jgi:hypothetical protein